MKDVCSSVPRKLAGLADQDQHHLLEHVSTVEKDAEDRHRRRLLEEQVSALEKQVEEHERLWKKKTAEEAEALLLDDGRLLTAKKASVAVVVEEEARSRRDKASLFVHAVTHGGVRRCVATAAGKAQLVAVQRAWEATCTQLEDENVALKRQLNASIPERAVLESELEAASKQKQVEDDNNAAIRKQLEDDNVSIRKQLEDDNAAIRKQLEDDNAAIRKQLEDENAAIRKQLEDENAAIRKQLEEDNGALKSQLEASVSQINELEAQMGAMADTETHLASALAESVAEVRCEV